MKRIVLLCALLMAFNLNAQIPFGNPVYFSALNGAVYNPGTHDNQYYTNLVTDRSNEEWSFQERLFLNRDFGDTHPGHIILDEATVTYNCHGYTFGITQGSDRYNISWRSGLCHNAFELVVIPQPGDIAVMRYNNGEVDSPHSAIVYDQDTLISKWGELPLTKHHKDSVIRVAAYEMGNAHYTYYRRVINTNDRIHGPATFNGTGTYYFDHNDKASAFSCTWSVEPAAMFQNASGSGTTASLSYATPFVYLAPKATITFTFGYGCDNHYTATKEIDLRIPTTTVSGIAISDGFVIDANAVVTVTGQIKSNQTAKAIVPTGTKLIIDGGKMTSNGSVMWPGVEVWGNCFTHQYAVNGVYGQGYIELKNGAVIENAVCAVELWRPDHWGTTGGIIYATDATFLNNAESVHALCYRNYRPQNNNEADYKAYFRNCEFVVNGAYLGGETFKRHVQLADVRGVRFLGCDFSADRSVTGVDRWCMGIGAYDAGFVVSSYCENSEVLPCPENDKVHSAFTGFSSGIRAASDGNHPRAFTVGGAVFSGNDIGIYATNTDFPTILHNVFSIGGEEYCQYNYGVYLRNVSSFCVEENEFAPSLKALGSTLGIAIYDSQGINDVYMNRFVNLSCGNLAKGDNAMSTLGLTYSCNTNTGNSNDFVVLQKNGSGGIQAQQGSAVKPAGNIFGATGYQFYNEGSHYIDYYYNTSNTGETPGSSHLHHVTTHGTSVTNACRSHYGDGPVEKSPSEKETLASEYLSAYNLYSVTQMEDYAHEWSLAAGDIIRSNLNESEANPVELRYWLSNLHDIAADRMAASSYLQEGDSAAAFALAKAIPKSYGLQGEGLADHADYLRLLQLYQTLHRTGRTVYQLADEEKGVVGEIATNGAGFSKSLAETLLEQITGNPRSECYETTLPNLRNGYTDDTGTMSDLTEETVGPMVEISPNPAAASAVLDYEMPAAMTGAVVDVINTLGVTVLSVELKGNKGQQVLDFHGLSRGVYTYAFRCGRFVKTGKLVITK